MLILIRYHLFSSPATTSSTALATPLATRSMTMLELRGGLLWSTGSATTKEDSRSEASEVPPLLLASTERLLQKLAPLHNQHLEEDGGSQIDDDSEEIVAVVTEDEEGDQNQTSKKVDEEGSIQTPKELKGLTAVRPKGCLADLIIISLEDIFKFHQRGLSDNRKRRDKYKNREQSRLMALEDQRDRLLQQQRGAQEQNLDEDALTQNQENPWLRLARTLNSLAVVTPLLQNMLHHKHRNNNSIRIGTATLNDAARKSQCWLLGGKVFDVTTTNRCKSIEALLASVYDLLRGIEGKGVITDEDDRKEALERTMHFVAAAASRAATDSSLKELSLEDQTPWWKPPSLLFTQLSDVQKQALEKLLPIMDDKFGLLCDRNDSEHAEHAQYLKSINNLRQCLASILEKRFPGSRLKIYGSCLSDLSLGKAADVDINLFIPELQRAKQNYESGRLSVKYYNDTVKKIVYQTVRCIEQGQHKSQFCKMVPVTRARVPVVKGEYLAAGNPYSSNGSIDFDICFLNEIAVANSELLRQYCLVDARAKALILAVKKWAKFHKICSAQDNHMSSYAWVNLVVFYMQCIGLIPNLQCPELRAKAGVSADPDRNEWHRINNLDTFFLTWEQAKAVWSPAAVTNDFQMRSVTSLLYGFFAFYSQSIPGSMAVVSIKRGQNCQLPKTVFRKISFFFCIEDPFETHDSHMPHDLALPVSETAARRIVQCMRNTEEHLRTVLLNACDSVEGDGLPAISSLWPHSHKMSKSASDGKPAPLVNNATHGPRESGIDQNEIRAEQNQPLQPVKNGISASMAESQVGATSESVARVKKSETGRRNDNNTGNRRGGNPKGKQPTKPTPEAGSPKPVQLSGHRNETYRGQGNAGNNKISRGRKKKQNQLPKSMVNGVSSLPKPGTQSSADEGSMRGTQRNTATDASLTLESKNSAGGEKHRPAEQLQEIKKEIKIAATGHVHENPGNEGSAEEPGPRNSRNRSNRKQRRPLNDGMCFLCHKHGHVKANCPSKTALLHDRGQVKDRSHASLASNQAE